MNVCASQGWHGCSAWCFLPSFDLFSVELTVAPPTGHLPLTCVLLWSDTALFKILIEWCFSSTIWVVSVVAFWLIQRALDNLLPLQWVRTGGFCLGSSSHLWWRFYYDIYVPAWPLPDPLFHLRYSIIPTGFLSCKVNDSMDTNLVLQHKSLSISVRPGPAQHGALCETLFLHTWISPHAKKKHCSRLENVKISINLILILKNEIIMT